MSLQELDIKDTYSSSTKDNDLVLEFYNPVIEQAVTYDRITGFFSPAILAIASRGFAALISTGGKIRLITSVQLDDRLYQSITAGSSKLDDKLLEDFDFNSIKSELDKDYLAVFAWLYKTGQLEMKVAITSKDRSMLHQKIGIITDSEGNAVSFSGSNNETPNGWRYNIEQFKVFKSWNPHTLSFFESDKGEFDVLWNNLSTKADVMYLDSAIKDNLIQKIEKHRKDDIKTVVNRIRQREHANKIRIAPARGKDIHFVGEPTVNSEKTAIIEAPQEKAPSRSLFEYQDKAILHWFSNDCKSIFEMATGTGKTFTSINALKQFREKYGYLRAVVVVPLTTLTIQWKNDIREIISDIQIINTSTDTKWRDELRSLAMLTKLGPAPDYIIVTTYSNFPGDDFSNAVEQLSSDFILVTDEMHNLVTKRGMAAASKHVYKYRLGLSATPTRLWKPQESHAVARMFGDNRYTYDIKDALENDFLVKFDYMPIPVHLDQGEFEEYVQLSREIGRMYAAKGSTGDDEPLNKKLNARARIKKNAESKIPALEQLVSKLHEEGAMHHSLIYVDNEKFLTELQLMLTRNNILTTKFVGETPLDDRLTIIDNLRTGDIGAIVAIRCLDEGVDIPSAQTAFFLSNNTDPREYVQRLGRVLRKDRGGNKQVAHIYDYIVMPPPRQGYDDESERNIARNLIKGELIRAKFFEDLAINADTAKSIIDDKIDEYGFNYEEDELIYNTEEDY